MLDVVLVATLKAFLHHHATASVMGVTSDCFINAQMTHRELLASPSHMPSSLGCIQQCV